MLYFLAYSVLGVSRYFWYYAPLVPGLIVLLGLGISSISNSPPPNSPFLGIWGRPGGGQIAMLALLFYLVLAQVYDLGQLRQRPDNRLVIYPVVGEWLRDHTPPQASVGTLEVGLIGYYSQRRMIDFAGLIQPQVSNQLTTHTTYEDAALWAVEHYRPDYLVLHENHFPRLEQGYAAQDCVVIKRFPGNAYGYSANLDVYACK
jgi:hypothetical protein